MPFSYFSSSEVYAVEHAVQREGWCDGGGTEGIVLGGRQAGQGRCRGGTRFSSPGLAGAC